MNTALIKASNKTKVSKSFQYNATFEIQSIKTMNFLTKSRYTSSDCNTYKNRGVNNTKSTSSLLHQAVNLAEREIQTVRIDTRYQTPSHKAPQLVFGSCLYNVANKFVAKVDNQLFVPCIFESLSLLARIPA